MNNVEKYIFLERLFDNIYDLEKSNYHQNEIIDFWVRDTKNVKLYKYRNGCG